MRSSVRQGACWNGEGVRFALSSRHATAAEVCLFRSDDLAVELARLALERTDEGLWTGFVDGVEPGTGYGFRVDGPRDASNGHRFNPRKLLIDPHARAIAGAVRWNDAWLGSSTEDSAPFVPKCLVIDESFDWRDDAPPRTEWGESLIYECHVRGLTRLHPEVRPELRGTYLGLAQEPILEHLAGLGVTAVELMPVQHFATERHLAERGLPNYWGYSPISFFAPHSAYATGHLGEQVSEFKTMVLALHRAGIEVILDFVLNHTAEGDAAGPTLSLRGIDNATYYRLRPEDPSRHVDFTGCGNTLDFSESMVRDLALESLRYWVEEMHVDGFRLDLATTVGRGAPGFSPRAPFFDAVEQDPVLSRVKWIAEPWDLGPDGYQAGRFPDGWREWNDRYRDTLRRFWRGDGGQAPEMATRLAGSSDRFDARGPGAAGSINYVTCHDGFTLEDLVSYERKDNSGNLEDNRDGRDDNLSRNWGIDGPTGHPEVLFARQRAKKNLLGTLAMSMGVPMLSHGDEMGRSQKGNNNAYCQDNAVSWIDWELDARDRELLDFTRRAFALRRELRVFDRAEPVTPAEVRWLDARGRELDLDGWRSPERRELGVLIQEAAHGPCGLVLLLLNARAQPLHFRLPETVCGHPWTRRIATVVREGDATPGAELELPAYSFTVLACSAASGAAGSSPPAPD